MMVRRLRLLTLALFALALVVAGPARAEIATHTVDEERWGEVFVDEEAGKVLPNPLLPLGALTGFETKEDQLKDPCGMVVNGTSFTLASYYSKKIYHYFQDNTGVHWYPYGDIEQRKEFIYLELEKNEPIYPDNGPCLLAEGSGGQTVQGF